MKNLAGYQGRTNIKNPHLVLKIGYSLRTMIILAKLMYTKSLEFDNVKKMKAIAMHFHNLREVLFKKTMENLYTK